MASPALVVDLMARCQVDVRVWHRPCDVVRQEASQHVISRRITELLHSLSLYLTDALTCDAVNPTDLVKCLRFAVHQPVPHRNYVSFALRQGVEDSPQLLPKQS